VTRAVGVLASLGVLLWWAAGSPDDLLVTLLRHRPPGFDDLLVDVAGAIAWICLCWFGVVVGLHLVASGSGAAAFACRRVVGRAGPRFMLGAARGLVGATLLVGPLTPGVAAAAQPGDASAPPASAAAVLSLDRPLTPNLDRPLAPAAIGGTPATAAGIPTGSAPAASQLPASQLAASQLAASQLRASQTPTAAAPARALPTLPAVPATSRAAAQLLTGTAHRDNANVIANANANANAARTAGRDYVVRPGDTLWDIAARHLGPNASNADIARAWPRWYAANRVSIGANPQLIHPGLVLQPPSD
jgi:hypothetical protein